MWPACCCVRVTWASQAPATSATIPTIHAVHANAAYPAPTVKLMTQGEMMNSTPISAMNPSETTLSKPARESSARTAVTTPRTIIVYKALLPLGRYTVSSNLPPMYEALLPLGCVVQIGDNAALRCVAPIG